ISEAMIAQARQYCPSAEYRCTDILSLTFDTESFDVIICALVLGHVHDIYPALEKLSSLLKVNGVLNLSDFHPTLTQMNSKRTFQDAATGKTFAIKHYLHHLHDIIGWLNQAGLFVERL